MTRPMKNHEDEVADAADLGSSFVTGFLLDISWTSIDFYIHFSRLPPTTHPTPFQSISTPSLRRAALAGSNEMLSRRDLQ